MPVINSVRDDYEREYEVDGKIVRREVVSFHRRRISVRRSLATSVLRKIWQQTTDFFRRHR